MSQIRTRCIMYALYLEICKTVATDIVLLCIRTGSTQLEQEFAPFSRCHCRLICNIEPILELKQHIDSALLGVSMQRKSGCYDNEKILYTLESDFEIKRCKRRRSNKFTFILF